MLQFIFFQCLNLHPMDPNGKVSLIVKLFVLYNLPHTFVHGEE